VGKNSGRLEGVSWREQTLGGRLKGNNPIGFLIFLEVRWGYYGGVASSENM